MQPTNRNPALENERDVLTNPPIMSEFDEEASSFSLGSDYHHHVYDGLEGQNWLLWDANTGSGPWGQHPAAMSLPYSQPYEQQLHVQQSSYQTQNNPYLTPVTDHVYPQQHYDYKEAAHPVYPQNHPYSVQNDPQHNVPYHMYNTPPLSRDSTAASSFDSKYHHVRTTPDQQAHYGPRPYIPAHQQFSSLPIRQQTPSTLSHPAEQVSETSTFINTFVPSTDTFYSTPLTLNWSPTASDEDVGQPRHLSLLASSKRKHSHSPSPIIKQEVTEEPIQPQPKGISDYLVVFENSPGALASVKKRKKLDAPVRKAAKDVRKAGACHQCRFRKRTCGTGTPCTTCLKQGSSLCELRCQRESPFVGKFMSRYFEYSSNRRMISFNITIPAVTSTGVFEVIDIDGVGRLSHPLKLRARRQILSKLDAESQDAIRSTQAALKGGRQTSNVDVTSAEFLLLEDNNLIGNQVEQWAMEYTSKYIHAAGPDFYSTTIAQIIGTAYVKKGLPETPLIASMLRAASLAFVLRAGVKYTMPENSATLPSPHFRTIQARIDSILYARLKVAERDLFSRLQIIIFRTAGCLGKDQIYPVALVMFQLMRMLSLGASHVSNIVERFGTNATASADHMHHCQRLLLSVHLALFRTSTPLLLDFRLPTSSPSPSSCSDSSSGTPAPQDAKSKRQKTSKPEPQVQTESQSKAKKQKMEEILREGEGERPAPNFNRALLNNDDELCTLAMKMRKVIIDFRKKGLKKEMKGSIVWRPEVWELFRRVYDGL